MKKQELQKAIENGESVWYLFGEAYELKTSEHTDKFITRSDDYCYTDKSGVDRECPLDMLYKSRGEAEHYLNHANITRTETLPFVTWEEFKEQKKIRFSGFEGNNYALQYVDSDNIIYLYDCWKNSCEDEEWEATEENFYKAYDECIRLFKGGG